MKISQRNLAVAGAVAVGAASLLRGPATLADASDEAAVAVNVEALAKHCCRQTRRRSTN